MKVLKSRPLAAAAVAALSLSLAIPAQATEADGQALAQCVQLSTNGKDRILTARWLLAVMASAPQLHDVVQVDPQLKQQTDMGMAALFTRLLTVDCLGEAKVVFQGGDTNADMRQAFELLGQIAMKELFGDNSTNEGLTAFAKYLDEADFDVLKP